VLGKISNKVNLNSKWAKAARGPAPTESTKRVTTKTTVRKFGKTTSRLNLGGKKKLKKRGIKQTGGFGSDFIDRALTAPPKHMPLIENSNTFLTETTTTNNNRSGNTSRWASSTKKSKKYTHNNSGLDRSFDVTRNINDENELDSVENSAANASDAPPGEKELGNLLDKKIRLMQRNVLKSRNGNASNANYGRGMATMSGMRNSGKLRGILRPKSAAAVTGARGTIGMGRRSSTAAFERSGGGGGGDLNSSMNRGKIRPPPQSKLRRPKSAVLRRLPY